MKNFPIFFLGMTLLTSCGQESPVVSDTPVTTTDDNKTDTPIDNNLDVDDGKDDAVLEVRPENFVSGVSNPYFTLIPGRKLSYDGIDPNGVKIHKEILASDLEREIAGVKTLAAWDREWHDNSLVKDTKRYYAQDKDGNVWLFGETELDIFGGYMKNKGSEWFHGENNAKAGIVVPGVAQVGDEIARAFNGLNEEKAEVLAVGEAIDVPKGAFADCLKIRDYAVGEGAIETYDYYCKDIGNFALELVPDTFGKISLAKVEDNFPTTGLNLNYPELKITVAETKAKEIALDEVLNSDEVTAINLVLRNDDPVYAVDVLDDDKDTTRVFIDINSGKVLTTEKLKS